MKTKVSFFDLAVQFKSIEDEIKSAMDDVFQTQQFILGSKVKVLEETIAQYCRTRYAIGVASGSDALLLSLMALGIGTGDEVLLPPFTFFATAGSVSRLGAIPVFVDIDQETFNIDPSKIEEKITSRTKAIIPVHLFGQCADMDPLLKIAKKKKLFIIEDAAQALGAEYKPKPGSDGRRAGQIGDLGCFSFYPTKNLGAFGDGGMVVTDNLDLAEKVRLLRVHGSQPKYFHKRIGINSRLDTIQAAILLVKFKHLEKWTIERQKKAERYQLLFQDLLSSVNGLKLPTIQYQNRHIFHQYVIRVPERDRLKKYLTEEGVGTDIYYPVPLHLQECYSFLKYHRGDLPNSEKASEEVLALPIYPELTEGQQWAVVDRIKAFYKRRAQGA
ncbi:MAG: transcriptional regulator [Deltaproteobacteria bacterium CG_4_8_14_3_um_filter_45_9]|nr:MAG: transcriptional regulator [Deltaproteobacteria bacterium CG03_land_8_20_14_0_80_45_14]PIX25828.1 MAG: transcriptional regulator [Deltaproteobacteria bacterium CG_4_8_14_3_um_filter_45_9]